MGQRRRRLLAALTPQLLSGHAVLDWHLEPVGADDVGAVDVVALWEQLSCSRVPYTSHDVPFSGFCFFLL